MSLEEAVPTDCFAYTCASEFSHFHKCKFSADLGFEKEFLNYISFVTIVSLLHVTNSVTESLKL